MPKPKLSIVTGTLDRPSELRRLIDSIKRHTVVDYEVIVADAGDTPVNRKGFGRRVIVLPEKPRKGCTKGYNRAFQHARGEWTLWLNDDCEVMPGYAEEAIRFMQAHPEIGLGALHYSEDDSPFHVNSAWGATYANFGILRTELGNTVGWFDEELEMYGNDNSLTFRVLLAGFGVADIPNARVIHHSTKDLHRVENQRSRMRDNQILSDKYHVRQSEWLAVFNRYRLDSPVQAWPHGVPTAQ